MNRTMCMQLSVDVARWPDDMLDGLLIDDETGAALPASAARAS